MLLSDISVKRPVFASVLSLLLIIFGIVSFTRLSLREYPNIDAPIVTIEVTYPGAPANIVETRITEIIEERISGIEGIESIESESEDGESKVTIEFSIDQDIDAAANDVRDRVSGITDDLPQEADPPEIQKVDSNDDVIIWQNLASENMSVPELTDYAERYLVDQYATLDGVARVRVGGGLRYAMRIWLDRQALAARDLSVLDIEEKLLSENIELPAGSLESESRLFKARVNRYFNEPEDFNKIVLSEGEDGYLVRLGDVARVELGLDEDRTFFRGNNVPMVGIGIIKQSTANTINVARNVKSLTAKINKTLPDNIRIEQSYDSSVFIEAAINEVYITLFIAIICVIIVIYMFLGSFRAMLIPAVTVPVSLISTFIIIYFFGFSINLLTLLALVLAIGMVVDDAIIMLENIVRRMQEHSETALVAAYKGARQVGFAVIATTLVLLSVFFPITFLEGDIGRLFTEFSITISASIIFSSFVALTLSPMLASKILHKSNNENNKQVHFKIVGYFHQFIRNIRSKYVVYLKICLQKPIYIWAMLIIIIGATATIFPRVDKEFAPKEDRGAFFVIVNGAEGLSYNFMEKYMTEIEARLMPYIESGEFKRLLVRTPRAFGNIESFNSGIVIIMLDDWSNRRPANVIMKEVKQKLSSLPGVRAFTVMRQGLSSNTQKPVQFVISGPTYEELADWRDILFEKINAANPGFVGLDSDYKETRPQLDFNVDYERAASLGVTIEEIGRTLETMLSGRQVTTFLQNGEEYDVIIEGERDEQNSIADISSIYVKSERTDQLIPLSNLIDVDEYGAAETLTRYNRLRSITIEANLQDDLRLGAALDYLTQLVNENLPDIAIIDYKGESLDYINSGNAIYFIFLLGLVIVFLVLAAQFESYIHPFIIIITVPFAIFGGLLALMITGNSINIYSQIALIMLVGLAAKNSILIVEFANQLRDDDVPFADAIIESARTRFRPIIMTGLTTIAGSIPLILSSGAGAETRSAIGIVVFSGVLIATFFTLFIVPVFYNLFAKNTKPVSHVEKRLKSEI
ncbi:MAG: efflux RND transporter permease subunit [Pseudomonadota bacterium]